MKNCELFKHKIQIAAIMILKKILILAFVLIGLGGCSLSGPGDPVEGLNVHYNKNGNFFHVLNVEKGVYKSEYFFYSSGMMHSQTISSGIEYIYDSKGHFISYSKRRLDLGKLAKKITCKADTNFFIIKNIDSSKLYHGVKVIKNYRYLEDKIDGDYLSIDADSLFLYVHLYKNETDQIIDKIRKN